MTAAEFIDQYGESETKKYIHKNAVRSSVKSSTDFQKPLRRDGHTSSTGSLEGVYMNTTGRKTYHLGQMTASPGMR